MRLRTTKRRKRKNFQKKESADGSNARLFPQDAVSLYVYMCVSVRYFELFHRTLFVTGVMVFVRCKKTTTTHTKKELTNKQHKFVCSTQCVHWYKRKVK